LRGSISGDSGQLTDFSFEKIKDDTLGNDGMKRIFISSVIKGFEAYRAAARAAVEIMGHAPGMSEAFAARTYSSRQACLTEVETCDIFVLILGPTFGFEVEAGVSATQAEFRHARTLGKPILVFVQDNEMEPAQAKFRREVEDFHTGFFRASFGTPEELKDEVVRGLRQLEQASHALPEERFLARVQAAMGSAGSGWRSDALLSIGFLPQPEVRLHLPDVEASADVIFTKLCNAGLAFLRDGYEMDGEPEVVVIRSNATELRLFHDGLRLIRVRPQLPERERASFDSMFVPPSYVRKLASSAFSLFDANSGWCYIGLAGMEHHVMRERPQERVTSISLPMRSDVAAEERRLFQPLTRPAYEAWIKQAVELFERRFRR
jgi:hypothetical protein